MTVASVSLGDLIQPASSPRAGARDYPILSMTMHGGLVDQATKFKKRVASEDTSAYKVVRREQLVVGFPIDEGVLSFQNLYDEAIVSPAYDVWDVRDTSLVASDYLEKFLKCPRSLAFYRSKLRSTTARRRSIPRETFLGLKVPLPPLGEQKRIAAILDQADELRRKRQSAIDRLNQLGQAIFHEMFGDPATNPRGWPVGTIRDFIAEAKYGTAKKANTEGRGTPILRMGNLSYDGQIDLNDIKYVELESDEFKKYTTKFGDILFNRTNSKELVGKTAVVTQDEPLAIAGYLVRARVNNDGNPFYVAAYLNSPHGKTTLRNMCKNIVGMANINAQEFQNIRIAKPPRHQQDQFQEAVLEIERRKAPLRAALAGSESLFASLQHRAFRGEL